MRVKDTEGSPPYALLSSGANLLSTYRYALKTELNITLKKNYYCKKPHRILLIIDSLFVLNSLYMYIMLSYYIRFLYQNINAHINYLLAKVKSNEAIIDVLNIELEISIYYIRKQKLILIARRIKLTF